MPQVIGQEIAPWDPRAVIQYLMQQDRYENELHMVFHMYHKKGHQLTKDTAEGVLHSFKSGFIDVILLEAANLITVKPL
jgi:hypothetical protein